MWFSFEHFVERENELAVFTAEQYNTSWEEKTKNKIDTLLNKDSATKSREDQRALRNLEFMFNKITQLIDKK